MILFGIGYLSVIAVHIATSLTARSNFCSIPLYEFANLFLIALLIVSYYLFLAVSNIFKFASTCYIVAVLQIFDYLEQTLGGHKEEGKEGI